VCLVADLFNKKDPSGCGRANFNVEEVFSFFTLFSSLFFAEPNLAVLVPLAQHTKWSPLFDNIKKFHEEQKNGGKHQSGYVPSMPSD